MTDAKRVVITGATGGLGSAMVRLYTELGSDVAALVHTKRLDADSASGNVREYVCDIADKEQVDATFDLVHADLGGIDALIHTVGIESKVAAADIGPADIAEIFSVNFNGTVFCNQAAYRAMRSGNGGSIVNFHSMAAIKGFPMVAHYAASKSAVGGWTRTIAIEWGADNVRANAVAPIMLSPTMEGYLSSLTDEGRQAFYEASRKDINLKEGQFGDPYSDIAPVVQFLAGDGSRYMTGQTISVDGGWAKLGS
jgi:2-hydroxycyclohexanecarboxyl-CoA dehydrogenase